MQCRMLVYTDVSGQTIGPIFRGQNAGLDFDIRQLIIAVSAVRQCADVRHVFGSMLRCVDCVRRRVMETPTV